MRWLVLSVVTLLAASTVPAITAGGSDQHWNGYVLDIDGTGDFIIPTPAANPDLCRFLVI